MNRGELELQKHRVSSLLVNGSSAVLVAFILLVDCMRIYPIASITATCIAGARLAGLWVRDGRPRGFATPMVE